MYYYIAIIYYCCFNLDTLNTFLQPSGFGQNTVGQRQDVICSISLPPLDTIELGWLYEDDIITDDSRVTIDASSYYFNDSTLVKAIYFNRLIEKDRGEYTCYAIVNGSFIFEFLNLQNFISKFLKINIYVCTHIVYLWYVCMAIYTL